MAERTTTPPCAWPAVLVLVAAGQLAACNCHQGTELPDDTSSSSSSEGSTSAAGNTTANASTTGAPASSEGGETDGTSSSTGNLDEGECNGAHPCADGQFCIAPYANNVREPFACVDECLGIHDEANWCFDASACCDATASCTTRGYCELPGGGSSSSDGGTGSSSG